MKVLMEVERHVELMGSSRVIPIVPFDPRAIEIVKSLGFDSVIVSFHQVLLDGLYNVIIEEGVSNTLGFHGKIYLSSIMPDELLLKRDTFDAFVHLLDRGNFYATIAWDMPVEIDLPKEVRWRNLKESIHRLKELKELGFRVLPLVKGNFLDEITFSVNGIKSLGFNNVALHASEYAANFDDCMSRDILNKYLSILQRYFNRIYFIGVFRPYVLNHILRNIYHREKCLFCGPSWWLDAINNKVYSTDNTIDLYQNVLETDNRIYTFRDNVEDKAKHNLNVVRRNVEGIYETYRVFDVYLRPPVLVLCDIHIGLPESLFQEALDFIRKTDAVTIVLNGDIFDYSGEVELAHIIDFYSTLEETGAEIVVLSGEKEKSLLNPDKHFLQVFDKLVFGDEPWTKPVDKDIVQRFILWFYKYNRVMKREVVGILPDHTKILFMHGNTIGRYSMPLENVTRRAKIKKTSKNVDKIILGHFYRFLIDEKNNVYVSGGWIKPLEEMQRKQFSPEVGALLINEDNSIEVLYP